MRSQEGNILEPIAQGRQIDPHHVEAVEQVFAELALLNHRFQRPIGGGDQPHVDIDRVALPHVLDAPFLEHPQQFDLHRHRHIADFVEKQRAAIGLFKGPLRCPEAPVKRLSRVRRVHFRAVSLAAAQLTATRVPDRLEPDASWMA